VLAFRQFQAPGLLEKGSRPGAIFLRSVWDPRKNLVKWEGLGVELQDRLARACAFPFDEEGGRHAVDGCDLFDPLLHRYTGSALPYHIHDEELVVERLADLRPHSPV